MTLPTFSIGDEVLIIGPTITGCKLHTGERFTIEQVDHNKYSGYGLPYYPASSLQLVKEIPMRITYNYKPDDAEHGTIQVSCPCGRKADIALPERSEWKEVPDELKIGDFVEVIGHPKGILAPENIGQVGQIDEISPTAGRHVFRYYYDSPALRKLTPEEIKQHIAPKLELSQEAKEKIRDLVSDAITGKSWAGIDERLVYHDGLLEGMDKRLSAIEKRLDFVEKSQRDSTKRAKSHWTVGS